MFVSEMMRRFESQPWQMGMENEQQGLHQAFTSFFADECSAE